MNINNKSILTVKDIATILRIGLNKAYELVKKDGFPKVKIGRAFRIPKDEFYIWMKKQCNN